MAADETLPTRIGPRVRQGCGRPIDEAFTATAVKIRCRPHVTHRGGATKTAVGHEHP